MKSVTLWACAALGLLGTRGNSLYLNNGHRRFCKKKEKRVVVATWSNFKFEQEIRQKLLFPSTGPESTLACSHFVWCPPRPALCRFVCRFGPPQICRTGSVRRRATRLCWFKASLCRFKASLCRFKASLCRFKASLCRFKASLCRIAGIAAGR